MFYVFRIVFMIVALVAVILTTKHRKRTRIILLIISTVAIVVLEFLPIENFIYSFKSPEAVAHYCSIGNDSDFTIYGNDSALVKSVDNGNNEKITLAEKSNNGWKIGKNYDVEMFTFRKIPYVSTIYYFEKTDEYYVCVCDYKNVIREISDSLNSDVQAFYVNGYYQYLIFADGFTDDYKLIINDEEYDVLRFEHFGVIKNMLRY